MSDIRDKAQQVLARVPATGEVRSDHDAKLFGELTGGVTQEDLMKNWRPPTNGIRTVCIDFICWYAGQMGIDIMGPIPSSSRNPKVDGFFALRETLIKGGKGYAYVAATKDGPPPQCGDILRHKAFHVDVALGVVNGVLVRVAGGQSNHPRPTADVSGEYDNVKRVTGSQPYDFSKLDGWLDLDKFFGPPPGSLPKGKGSDADKTGSLWFNEDGDLVHPDAPFGGGGPGFFRAATSLGVTPDNDFLPHPKSPVARTLDPLKVQREQENWSNEGDADQLG